MRRREEEPTVGQDQATRPGTGVPEFGKQEPPQIPADRFAEVTRLLLERGADIQPRDRWGRTPLMVAAKAGNKEMVELLLGWEADVNARDQRGYTALMYAAWKGHADIVRVLIDRGADVRSVDNETGYTPVLLAALGAEETAADFSMTDELD